MRQARTIQRLQTLGQAGLQVPPLIGREHARHAVHGDDPLLGLGVPVDGEGDPLGGKRARYPFLYALELLDGKVAQFVMERSEVLARRAAGQKHLVVAGSVDIVRVEIQRRAPTSYVLRPE